MCERGLWGGRKWVGWLFERVWRIGVANGRWIMGGETLGTGEM